MKVRLERNQELTTLQFSGLNRDEMLALMDIEKISLCPSTTRTAYHGAVQLLSSSPMIDPDSHSSWRIFFASHFDTVDGRRFYGDGRQVLLQSLSPQT